MTCIEQMIAIAIFTNALIKMTFALATPPCSFHDYISHVLKPALCPTQPIPNADAMHRCPILDNIRTMSIAYGPLCQPPLNLSAAASTSLWSSSFFAKTSSAPIHLLPFLLCTAADSHHRIRCPVRRHRSSTTFVWFFH